MPGGKACVELLKHQHFKLYADRCFHQVKSSMNPAGVYLTIEINRGQECGDDGLAKRLIVLTRHDRSFLW